VDLRATPDDRLAERIALVAILDADRVETLGSVARSSR
jgi:hypothetical protein